MLFSVLFMAEVLSTSKIIGCLLILAVLVLYRVRRPLKLAK
ncbi:hypothetical protein [Cricetibacter osteomyelitidis]